MDRQELLKLIASAQKRLKTIEIDEAFDPYNPDAIPTPEQQQFFRDITKYKHRYAIGGNQSGKTASGAWECIRMFQNSNPFWDNLEGRPLILLVMARTSKHFTSIWEDKLQPFLNAGEYRVEKQAGLIDTVRHLKNGNKIIFFSHNNPEHAREKVQYYVADWVWLDEMPNSFKLIEELHKRVLANKRARFIATFTPKTINDEIRRMVENKTKYHKKYVFKMLDNPKLEGRREEILASLETMPESYRRTVLEGDWYAGDTAVYNLRPDIDVASPSGLSPDWRHVEALDPAARGLVGFVLFAEDPGTGIWYVIRTEYIKGAAATELLDKLRHKTDGKYNIVRRICDPHETWFMDEASKQGRPYWGVREKTSRKMELIDNLKKALLAGRLKIAPWCTDLVDEFNSCQWSERVENKIVGSSRFHLLDAVQYGLDRLPAPLEVTENLTHDQARKLADQKRRKNKYLREQAAKKKLRRPGTFWARRGYKGRIIKGHAS